MPQRRLRVAVLNRNFDPTGGGAERYSIALVEHLAARHDIHVFAQTIHHSHPGVTYHRVSAPMRRPRWINQLWFAYATWRATRQGFDVVHSHENTWHGQVQTVHVLPIRYNLFVGRDGWRRALRWLKVATSPRLLAYLWLENRRYAPQPGRSLVATSNTLRDVVAATHPHTLPMLKVITPGVASAPGAATASEKLAARVALGLPTDGALVLFVANDFRKKGLDALLIACGQVVKGEPVAMPHTSHDSAKSAAWKLGPLNLAVVGNAAHAQEFRSQIKRLGLDSKVHFLGQLEDVSQAYLAADVLAHPTLEDTFGMVVLEAMAHGLPVVVSAGRHCGIAELLTHDVNALILPDPTDASALARELGSVLTDSNLQSRLGTAATKFACQYKWSNLSIEQEVMYLKSILSHVKT